VGNENGVAEHLLIPINTKGKDGTPPLYIVHPAGGFVFMYFGLVMELPTTSIYGFQDPSLEKSRTKCFKTVVDAAKAYTDKLLSHQPEGPYRIAGWSLGGKIAYEMACILSNKQKEVCLIIIDSWFDEEYHRFRFWAGNFKKAVPFIKEKFSHLKFTNKFTSKHHRSNSDTKNSKAPGSLSMGVIPQMFKTLHSHMKASARYKPEPYPSPAPVFVIRAEESTTKINKKGQDPLEGWSAVCPNLVFGNVPGDHLSMMNPTNIKYVGEQLASIFSSGTTIPKITK